MVLEKLPEIEKIKGWSSNVATFAGVFLGAGLVSAALLDGRPIVVASGLLVLAFVCAKIAQVVNKMDLFKHAPDALQNKMIQSMPMALFVIACLLAVFN